MAIRQLEDDEINAVNYDGIRPLSSGGNSSTTVQSEVEKDESSSTPNIRSLTEDEIAEERRNADIKPLVASSASEPLNPTSDIRPLEEVGGEEAPEIKPLDLQKASAHHENKNSSQSQTIRTEPPANNQVGADSDNAKDADNAPSYAPSPAPTATSNTAPAPTATPQTGEGSGEGVIRPKISGAPQSVHGGMPVGNVSGDTLVNVTKDGNLSSGGTTALYFGNDAAEGEAARRVVQNLLANNGQNLSRVGMAPGGAGGFKEGSYSARAVADIQEDAARRKLGRTFVHDKIVTDGLVGILNTFNGESGNPGSEVEQNGKRIVGIEKEACDEINAQLKQTGANYRVVGMSVQKGTDGNPLFKVYTVDKNGRKHCDIRTVKQVYETRKTALADASLGVRVKGETEAARAERRKAALALDGKTGQPSVIESGLINELGDVNFVDGAYRERNAEMFAKVEREKAAIRDAERKGELDGRRLDILEKEVDARIKTANADLVNKMEALGIEKSKAEALIAQHAAETEEIRRRSENAPTRQERLDKQQADDDNNQLAQLAVALGKLGDDIGDNEKTEQRKKIIDSINAVNARIEARKGDAVQREKAAREKAAQDAARSADEKEWAKVAVGGTMKLRDGKTYRKGPDGKPVLVNAE